MSSLRPFHALDLFRFNLTNLDVLTENYVPSFYLQYLAKWPTLCSVMESAGGKIMGYILGKAEGEYTEWHGHVTAVTVAPDFRRLGLAKTMMDELERVTTTVYNGYFVDLYVRVSNRLAIDMYEGLGYSVYRCVQEYYSAGPGELEEDAYDMRKPMKRDKKRQSVRKNGREFKVQPHEVY
ncbi:uncharacterized protein H6S33_009418 [Morchella sextelata]|uniref:uncharacterized protein n=1 Tax=Morchella sextelata TaxID=1174677 RepID=UPI001D049D78|nr:uncharacterized protein H6S33_009418 [Morchella sextelata]KAH0613038.1 hypothetical protein H6S33_009418 [Morchella sextelata]